MNPRFHDDELKAWGEGRQLLYMETPRVRDPSGVKRNKSEDVREGTGSKCRESLDEHRGAIMPY